MSYDWDHHLRVTLSSDFYGLVAGFCGNYNGDPNDDFMTPEGTLAPDANAFGESWWLKGEDDDCWHDCHGPCQPCPPDLVTKYGSEQYCGLITASSNGPFAPCHDKVNPAFFFESCVYDVCANEGHRPTLCDALKAYADACQREGVQIGEWRKTAGCLPQCPPNSEYQLCGTCPATCVDQGELLCPAVCVEGCQCKEGFVLSHGTCIPKSSCGCYYEGRPYAPNERFWADDKCSKLCVCNPATKQVECGPSACKASEKCDVQKGVRGCYPIDYGNCTAQGDPHYLTYDKCKYDFQGSCSYVLSEVDQTIKDVEWFGVYVENEHRGNQHVTWTRSVQVNTFNVEIIVSRQYPGKILVDGLLTSLPYSSFGGRVKAFKQGNNAVIQAIFGLAVRFDWNGHVFVTVPSTYAGILHGLCGNFNGNCKDDGLVPGTILIPSIPVFGKTKKPDPKCIEITDPKCPGMEAMRDQQRASGKDCGLIIAKDGPFRECHAHIDPEDAFLDCVYDSCFFKGHYTAICSAIANYAKACQAAGITIYPWRSSTFCPPACSRNSHYELCAKECGQSCSTLYVPASCPAKCEENCVCDKGFIKSNDACVPIAECGCFHQRQYYPVLEYFYPSCEERCQCQAGGTVVCELIRCGPNEECKLLNGVQKCHPTGSTTCSAIGSFYQTFDRLSFNFQGTCTYIFAKLQEKNVGLTPITVVVENEAWLYGNNAVIKLVRVQISSTEVTLLRNKAGSIMVDGVFHYLPVNLLGGQVGIYQHGLNIKIESVFGFELTYDLLYHLEITLPNTYQGQMTGLCGNYNGKQEDDLQLPDGSIVSDVATFVAAWKIPVLGVPCTDGCSGSRCPVCVKEKEELFKQRSSCGIITASDGPFQACHAFVDPNVYLNNCIFEMCIRGGDKDAFCQAIQSYVTACQEAKANIQPWRSPLFCPLTCPDNSHYSICSDICGISCAGITDKLKCPESCAEGCQCDDGFFFDGIKCVPMDDCGCFENNIYFPPNKVILLNNCAEKCVCSLAGGLICEAHACSDNEVCEVKNGVLQCSSKEPPSPSCLTVKCRRGMECQMINGQPKCVPTSNSTCWLWGDPHYCTFDGHKFDFQGTCTYTLCKTTNDNLEFPPFHIFTKNENRGNKHVSYMGILTFETLGYSITMSRSEAGFVRVDGIRAALPINLDDGRLQIIQSGNSVVITTDSQLTLFYDWDHHVRVTLSSAYLGFVTGLCGNYNEDPKDDFMTPEGTLAPDANAFGESWWLKGQDDDCWHDCHGPCQPCPPDLITKYGSEQYCGLITASSNGPFAPCHAKVNPAFFFESCVYDVCANEGHRPTLCDALKAYADACQREGVQIGEWRKTAGCLPQCPPNSEYQPCGTACPATCADQRVQLYPAICVEGCQCKEGFVLSHGTCIPRSSCGCYYEGRPYAPNERFWADNQCSKLCVCNPATRHVECGPSACKASERCDVQKGVRGCYPIDYGNCTAQGDPHYLTYDKCKYDFQGSCSYVLSEVDQTIKDVEWFGVYVENEHRGNQHVTWTRSVQVNAFDVEIVVSRQYPGQILVSGLLTSLPYSSFGGRVKAFKQGNNAVIQASFGLSVHFDWNGHVFVTVPSTYAGILHGLCGNFNGNCKDDGLVPGTILIPSIPVFGKTKKPDPKCIEITDPKCPGMETMRDQQRASGKDCGLIIAKDGPFRECHAHIDPEDAFLDCIYDSCFFKGHYTAICSAIANYAKACQAAGITIYPWRSSTFCPPACPRNSHYELCAKECGQSCSTLYVPASCPAKCEENCVCDKGFIKSNDACVPIAECGCFHRGQYYPVSEYFYPSCEERCQCQAGGTVVCEVIRCGPNEECKLLDGVQKCHPTGSATCSAIGSFYLTFDKLPFNFQGTCTYILAKLQENNVGLTPITVIVEHEDWLNGQMTVIKLVHVQIPGAEVTLLRNKAGSILVDGIFHYLPVNLLDGQVRIYQHGFNIRIESASGFAVTYDLYYHVRITVLSTYQGQMTGLCGNYNGKQEDDLQLPDGSVVSDVATFVAAWKIPVLGVSCTDGCSGSHCPLCEIEKQELFKQRSYCGILTASDGPFQACHAIVDPNVYLNNCAFELCINGGDKKALCQAIQSYVTACQEAKVNLPPWRSPLFCPTTCPPNSHYRICSNYCESNCARLTDRHKCPESCAEGCQCDDGFFFDGLKCVPLDNCGCFQNNRCLPQGESYLSSDCKTRCTCQTDGSVICTTNDCAAEEVCELTDGVHGCFSTEGHCTLMPGAHLSTFDGLFGDVPTPGSYQLVSICDPSSEDWFRVVVGVASCQPIGTVAPTLLHAFFKDLFISVNGHNEIWVNGLPVPIPYTAPGEVTLSLAGNTLLLQSPQVKVSLSSTGEVQVTVNPSLSGRVCGACGNFNHNQIDDLKGPGGVDVQNVPELMISWIAKDFTLCLE
nr:IgGFc-binding protein-like [Anolis sagrei ordinatus]